MYPESDKEKIVNEQTDSEENTENAAPAEDVQNETEETVEETTVETVDENTEETVEETAEETSEEAVEEAVEEATEEAAEEQTEENTDTESSEGEQAEEESKLPDKRNYLLYGGTDVPEGIDYENTLKFLTEQLKYDGGELRQARMHKDGSAIVKDEEKATEVCAYCGLPISGVDYYRLPDGRKRCTGCSRSLVKSAEDFNKIFNEILLNMELFFGAVIDVPVSVEMIEERKLKKKISKGLSKPPKDSLILGVAVEHKGSYTIYVENGIPRASLIATVAHELTHIWQYTHWKRSFIKKRYGAKMSLIVYEGMAMWTEIQYLYHIGEANIAKRSEILTMAREDEYGRGFLLYVDKYPLARETKAFIETPFSAGMEPLD